MILRLVVALVMTFLGIGLIDPQSTLLPVVAGTVLIHLSAVVLYG